MECLDLGLIQQVRAPASCWSLSEVIINCLSVIRVLVAGVLVKEKLIDFTLPIIKTRQLDVMLIYSYNKIILSLSD